jgi:hypothetical protein
VLAELFAPEATYQTAPFEEPFRGLPAIAVMWEAEREGPEEAFAMDSQVVAVEGDTGVARLEVRYGDPVRQTLPGPVGRPVRCTRPVSGLRGVAVLAAGRQGWLDRRSAIRPAVPVRPVSAMPPCNAVVAITA